MGYLHYLRRRAFIALPALLMLWPGLACSRSDNGRTVYPVRGQVLLDGKPAAHVLVAFHPEGPWGTDENRPYAQTDADGRFTVSTFGTNDGAPAGQYKVAIHAMTGEGEATGPRPDEGTPTKGPGMQVPTKYSNPETSGFRIRVNEGPNELAPFQLKSGPRQTDKPPPPPISD